MLSLTEKYRRGDLLVCNCADCGQELIGESHAAYHKRASNEEQVRLPMVAGRINGRPMRPSCCDSKRQQQLSEYLTPRQAAKLGTTGG